MKRTKKVVEERQRLAPARTFVTLDALRGIAALCILEYHFPVFFGGLLFPHGYLAVDFFFMLSGFVLTFAYQNRLDNGWSTGAFLKARVIRLYPLYLLALVISLGFEALGYWKGKGPAHGVVATIVFFGLGVFMLPSPGDSESFPLNGPSWSLFFELIANVFHAVILRKRSARFLAGMIAASGLCLLVEVERYRSVDIGWNFPQTLYGLSRVLFSYTFGVLIFRVWAARWFRISLNPAIPMLLLAVVLAVPALHGAPWVDFCMVALLFPVLLLVAANSQPSAKYVSLCEMIGIASYAIYILHAPLSAVFQRSLRVGQHTLRPPWKGFGYMAFMVAFALFIDRFYDVPVRNYLRGKLSPQPR